MTAIEWLLNEMQKTYIFNQDDFDMFKQAKGMERKEKAKRELFIGKVSEIIGADKTIELLKEVNNVIR